MDHWGLSSQTRSGVAPEPLTVTSRFHGYFLTIPMPLLNCDGKLKVSKYGRQDPAMGNFFIARFLLKFMARVFSYVPSDKASQQLWEQSIAALRDVKRQLLIRFFLRQLQRMAPVSGFPGLPGDLNNLFPQTGRPPHALYSAEDVMLARFVVGHSPAKEHQSHIAWVLRAIRSCQQSMAIQLDPSARVEADRTIGEFIRFFRTFKKTNESRVDLGVLQSLIDLVLYVRSNLIPLDIPDYLIPRCYLDLTFECILAGFQRSWSFDPFLLLLSWLVHAECPEFRLIVLAAFKDQSKEVIKYSEMSIPRDFHLVLLKAFRALDYFYTEYAPGKIDIVLFLPVAKTLFLLWFSESDRQNLVWYALFSS
jgi:hypothetical protein